VLVVAVSQPCTSVAEPSVGAEHEFWQHLLNRPYSDQHQRAPESRPVVTALLFPSKAQGAVTWRSRATKLVAFVIRPVALVRLEHQGAHHLRRRKVSGPALS
jgi:hypothetical protein